MLDEIQAHDGDTVAANIGFRHLRRRECCISMVVTSRGGPQHLAHSAEMLRSSQAHLLLQCVYVKLILLPPEQGLGLCAGENVGFQ